MRSKKMEKGQSLMEVIIASAVGVLVISALVFATIFSLRNASFAKNSAQATKLAQEGLEMVKLSRDRNRKINGITDVVSWNGDSSGGECTYYNLVNANSVWCFKVTGDDSESCDNPGDNPGSSIKCYFIIDPTSGELTYRVSSDKFPSSQAEIIESPDQEGKMLFQRVVYMADDTNWTNQKKVVVLVRWTDMSGPHESKLETILRRI